MPHFVLEHSSEIAASHDLPKLADALFEAAMTSDLVPNKQSIKLRMVSCENVRLGGGAKTFAHLDLYLLPGRSDETKTALSQTFFDVLTAHLWDVDSLSVLPWDMDEKPYLRRML